MSSTSDDSYDDSGTESSEISDSDLICGDEFVGVEQSESSDNDVSSPPCDTTPSDDGLKPDLDDVNPALDTISDDAKPASDDAQSPPASGSDDDQQQSSPSKCSSSSSSSGSECEENTINTLKITPRSVATSDEKTSDDDNNDKKEEEKKSSRKKKKTTDKTSDDNDDEKKNTSTSKKISVPTITTSTPSSSKETKKKDEVVMQGYLKKKGGDRRNWKKRWFVLTTVELSYWVKPNRSQKGSIQLEDVKSVQNASSKKHKRCFSVTTESREYMIVAESDEQRTAWMNALRGAISDIKNPQPDKSKSVSKNDSDTTLSLTPIQKLALERGIVDKSGLSPRQKQESAAAAEKKANIYVPKEDDIVQKGLVKMAASVGGSLGSWTRVYFILTSDRIVWFSKPDHVGTEPPAGFVFLEQIKSATVKYTSQKFTFEVVTEHIEFPTIQVAGANTQDRDQWVESINVACKNTARTPRSPRGNGTAASSSATADAVDDGDLITEQSGSKLREASALSSNGSYRLTLVNGKGFDKPAQMQVKYKLPKLKKKTFATDVSKKTKNPAWRNTLPIIVDPDTEYFELDVIDVGRKKFLGVLNVKLPQSGEDEKPHWLELQPKPGKTKSGNKPTGFIQVTVVRDSKITIDD